MSKEMDKARENYQRYIYMRDEGHLDYLERAQTCIDYYEGRQWKEETIRELDGKGLPYLTMNKIQPTIHAIVGSYLENRAAVSFTAARGGSEEIAKILSKVYVHVGQNNDLEQLELDVFEDGLVTGRGYFDVRIDFDDQLLGEVKIAVLNPKNVLPDPDADSPNPDDWNDVIVTKWMSEEDIIDLYGGDSSRRQDLRSISTPSFDYVHSDVHQSMERFKDHRRVIYTPEEHEGIDKRLYRRYRVLERQYKRLRMVDHFVDLSTGDMRPVPQHWDQQRIQKVLEYPNIIIMQKQVKEIHWLVTIDRFVLFEAKGFYDGFTIVPFFPYFRRGRTISPIEALISPQDMYNKVSSQELHVINTTANSGWMFKQNSLVGMDADDLKRKGAETGFVLEWSGDQPPIKIQPNQIPSGLDRLAFKANKDIFEISGVGESMRGIDRADVSARAIEEKRDAGGTGLGRVFQSLSFTRKLLARRVLSLVQGFYTEPRTLRISQDLFKPPEDLEVNAPDSASQTIQNDLTIGEYDVRLIPTPLRDSHDQSQFDELMRMKELGIHIPDYRLVQYSHIDDKIEVAEEVKQLTGGPLTEEAQQRISELEAELKQLELEEKKAVIEDKINDAKLKAARTKELLHRIEEGSVSVQELEKQYFQARMKEEDLARKDRELDIREQAMLQKFGVDAREQDRKEFDSLTKAQQAQQKPTASPKE